MYGKIENIEKIYFDLNTGNADYEISYKGKHYSINTYSNGTDPRTFWVDKTMYNSADELLDGFIVDGKSFREFFLDVDVIEEC